MFQLDGSAELQSILDGVFKPKQREERRAKQRYSRRGLMHQPLSLNYQGDDVPPGALYHDAQHGTLSHGTVPRGALGSGEDRPAEDHARRMANPFAMATTEDLSSSGYAEDRVINPPPPTPTNGHPGNTVQNGTPDTYGLAHVPPVGGIWSEGE